MALPRWWVWVFYATIVWGIGYTIAYPAWPLVTQATPGLLGASTRADVAAEIAAVDAGNAAIKERLIAADLNAIGTECFCSQYSAAIGNTPGSKQGKGNRITYQWYQYKRGSFLSSIVSPCLKAFSHNGIHPGLFRFARKFHTRNHMNNDDAFVSQIGCPG